MGKRPVIGESASEKATNRIANRIDNSLGKKTEPEKNPTLIEQIKKKYPNNWKFHVEEFQKEISDPEYKKAKDEEIERLKKEYLNIPRWQRDQMEKLGNTQGKYVNKGLLQWIENKK